MSWLESSSRMLASPPPLVLLSWVTQCLLRPSTEASTGLTQRLAQGCVESTASLPSPNGSLYSGISGQSLWENTVTSTGLESPGKTVRHPRPSSPFLQHWGEQTVHEGFIMRMSQTPEHKHRSSC